MTSGLTFKTTIEIHEGGLVREAYGDFNGELSLIELLNFTKSSLILISADALQEEQAAGFDKNPVVSVDGKVGKPIENVNPFGSIEYTARADMNEILLETYNGLLQRSPVLTGRYKDSHRVLWSRSGGGAEEVAQDLPSLEAWLSSGPQFADKDLVIFVDVQPYARKLERHGITQNTQGSSDGGRTVKSRNKEKRDAGVRVQVPNGVYFLTARAIRNKYRRNSIIKFDFISGQILGIQDSFKTKRRASEKTRAYLYPAIIISVRESGVT